MKIRIIIFLYILTSPFIRSQTNDLPANINFKLMAVDAGDMSPLPYCCVRGIDGKLVYFSSSDGIVLLDSLAQDTDTIIEKVVKRKPLHDKWEYVDLSQHEWQIQYSDSTTILRDIFFVNENTGWAVGQGGVFLNTSDGGDNWEKHIYADVDFFGPMFFVNSMVGYVCCFYDYPVKTTDGGHSWTRLRIKEAFTGLVQYFYFKDSVNGFMISSHLLGQHGDKIGGHEWVFLRSMNGGETWDTTNLGNDKSKVETMLQKYFPDRDTKYEDKISYRLNNQVLYKSVDGGMTWNALYPPPLSGVFFVDSRVGYALSARRMHILKTTTGGE
jgi:photosystem II stability/assembly factor-like uncharacterized protein